MKWISLKNMSFTIVLILSAFFTSPVLSSTEKKFVPEKIELDCDEDLYVLGWSAKGHIAYMKYYDIGGLCGFCPTYEFVGQSLVTDEIIFRKVFGEAMEYDSQGRGGDAFAIDEIMAQNYDEIYREIRKYGIKLNEKNNILGKQFKFNNDDYSFSFSVKTRKETYHEVDTPAKFRIDVVTYADLLIHSKNLGTKVVYKYRPQEAGYITGFSVENCLMSPFEKRVAVIMIQSYPFVEAGVKRSFRIIGAHLCVGF